MLNVQNDAQPVVLDDILLVTHNTGFQCSHPDMIEQLTEMRLSSVVNVRRRVLRTERTFQETYFVRPIYRSSPRANMSELTDRQTRF